ncbi:MAG: hypothetical protein J5I47_03005 [Vicingus serpentipes]|nr:hypothetical protein [Vicingus serpentipes]
MFSATTKIDMIVNGQHTFSIENGPDMGQLWITPIKMNREDLIQGQLALAEAAYKLMIHKIKMDSERVKNSKKLIDKA